MNEWMNEWCFRPLLCTEWLNLLRDSLGQWGESMVWNMPQASTHVRDSNPKPGLMLSAVPLNMAALPHNHENNDIVIELPRSHNLLNVNHTQKFVLRKLIISVSFKCCQWPSFSRLLSINTIPKIHDSFPYLYRSYEMRTFGADVDFRVIFRVQ